MSYYGKSIMKISGGNPLSGSVKIQGSKNAVLPIMAACILVKGQTIIRNCPKITDVFYMKKLLQSIGCRVIECIENDSGMTLAIDATNISHYRFPNEYVERMRSSIVLLGPILSRMKYAILKQPGGCTIGKRPIDMHIMALEQIGAVIRMQEDTIYAQAKQETGAFIQFPKQSVGATENAVLFAVKAKGRTILYNASGEPEILELCAFLNRSGAQISIQNDTKSCTIIIDGVEELHPVEYDNVSDRIVAGTYAFAPVISGGEVTLIDAPVSYMESTLDVIGQMGAEIAIEQISSCSEQRKTGNITIKSNGRPRAVDYLETAAYPGFPTDMQSVFLVASCLANGKTKIKEKIFENRFKIISELKRMGARIELHTEKGETFVEIDGVETLHGCNVLAKELRGGAALVLAGLCATDITTVGNIHFIRRGYENMERDLLRLGAKVSLANDND